MSITKYITVEGDATIQMHLDAGFELYGNPMLKYNGGSTNTVLQVLIMKTPDVIETETPDVIETETPATPAKPVSKKKAE